jgi:hypothetical protein
MFSLSKLIKLCLQVFTFSTKNGICEIDDGLAEYFVNCLASATFLIPKFIFKNLIMFIIT